MMDDLISRQAAQAIKVLPKCYREYKTGNLDDAYEEGWEGAMLSLNALPTVEQKHGQWIKMSDADGVYWSCSECGESIPRVAHYNPQFDLFPLLESVDKTSYCPHCGARMKL